MTSDKTGRLFQKLHNRARRKASSARWLERQINDPYVIKAQKEGYRSRSAYKLIELEQKFHFLETAAKSGGIAIDLGCAPGGWSQVATRIFKPGAVIALDILPLEPIPGVLDLKADFMEPEGEELLGQAIAGRAVALVLSDMAAPTTGHRATDHLRTQALAETALAFALDKLSPGGCFIAKVFQGGSGDVMVKSLRQHFSRFRHAKPAASRKESPETYLIAQDFKRGVKNPKP